MKIENKDKLQIAEFVMALQTNTVILSDAEKCVNSLVSIGLIAPSEASVIKKELGNSSYGIKRMFHYLEKIPNETKKEIMNDYYSGKL